jgi:proteasome accessory factor PafA2
MSVRRVMGVETEYGISVPGQPGANSMVTSSQVVNAYQAATTARARRARWDFEEENPLRDARGFDLTREAADSSQLTDEDLGLANVILTNGARLYVDHAHPEYSAPECTDPLDAVIWDKAGERVMEAAARHVASVPGAAKLQLYKNNVDGKGASYGSHENYLMSRQTPFSAVIAGLTPFLVSRQVVTGSGRVGIGPSGDEPGFQLSQRADYIEVEVGLETTLKRGIINTRDEPHADADRYRRLHVIIGDANLAETSTYLKLGSTALVLDLIEEGPAHGIDLTDLALARPVHAVHAISRDPSLRATVALADGRELTALALQRIYLDRAAKLVDGRDHDARAADVVETWANLLDLLERDPMECAELLDWPAKLRLLEGFRHRENLSWSAPRLHLVDLQYSDVRLDKGLYNRLVARGSMKRLVSEQQVLSAVDNPPTDTRAYFRGECLRRFGADIAAASWDSVIFDLGGDSLVRIPTLEPLRGSKAHVGALLDSVDSAAELVEQLTT